MVVGLGGVATSATYAELSSDFGATFSPQLPIAVLLFKGAVGPLTEASYHTHTHALARVGASRPFSLTVMSAHTRSRRGNWPRASGPGFLSRERAENPTHTVGRLRFSSRLLLETLRHKVRGVVCLVGSFSVRPKSVVCGVVFGPRFSLGCYTPHSRIFSSRFRPKRVTEG